MDDHESNKDHDHHHHDDIKDHDDRKNKDEYKGLNAHNVQKNRKDHDMTTTTATRKTTRKRTNIFR